MRKEVAEKILQETEKGYDLISKKFSQTRKHFWRGLEFLKDYTHSGDKVFDFGCGNGRLLELIGDIRNIEYYGADVSQKLVDTAKEKYVGENMFFQKIDPIQSTIPFEKDSFNTTYSIAVFHHFPSKEYREKMARELYRVTKKNGYVIITVWYLWQRKYCKNIVKNWLNKVLNSIRMPGIRPPAGEADSAGLPDADNLDWNDCVISFTDNNGIKFGRFHHAFTKRELKKLFKAVGFEIEECKVMDGRNIVLVGKK